VFGKVKVANRFCYITVDFATAASQKGFSNYKFYFHNKTNINQKIAKNIRFFYYFHLLP
jgi:hypothetical protein